MNWKDKTVLVFGTGISGIGACELLESRGAKVILFDGNRKIGEDEVRMKLPSSSSRDSLSRAVSLPLAC